MTQRMCREVGMTMRDNPVMVVTAQVRKEMLSEISRMPLDCESVTPSEKIKAIDTMNKMEGMYLGNQPINFKQINIVLVEKGGLPEIKETVVVPCEVKDEEKTEL